MDSFREQLYPIIAILALSFFVGIGSWITKLFGSKKMEKQVGLGIELLKNLQKPHQAYLLSFKLDDLIFESSERL